MTAAVDLSIVILVHETPDEAEAVLRSVFAHTGAGHEVIVVDNGSSPAVRERLVTITSNLDVKLIRRDENTSFAAGSNAGVAAACGRDVLLLNSDCLATRGWLDGMRAALASDASIAAVGPRSNCARGSQGGIWLDDLSTQGIERFARSFNHVDPDRWFDVDWLSGFAMLIRRNVFVGAGGFDETIRTGDGEDRDLSLRLHEAGHRLVCAGDSFVFHFGHRTYVRAGLNRTAMRLGRAASDRGAGATEEQPQLVSDERGRVFELHDGTANHIETDVALRLIREGRPIQKGAVNGPIGEPVSFVRAMESDDVWLVHNGRRRLQGDHQRVRRLPGISIIPPEFLQTIPESSPVDVALAMPPVPDMPPLLPRNPAKIRSDRLVDAGAVAADIAAALEERCGYSLIRLGSGEALLLNDGMWPTDGFPLNYAGVRGDHDVAGRALRTAIMDADAVGLQERRDLFYCAPLLEQLLQHYDLYPKVRCGAHVNFALMGVDPTSGEQVEPSQLLALLKGRRVAVVGRLAESALIRRERIGIDIRLAVGLDDMRGVSEAFATLEANRDRFDVVLAAASIPAKPLCSRLARELDVVALDIGHGLDRLLHPRYNLKTFALVKLRWEVGEYLRTLAQPAPHPPHEFEGRLIRAAGEKAVFYVERGSARWVASKAILPLFDHKPVEVSKQVVDDLPRGTPLCAVHERLTGPYLLLDGRKVPILMGLSVVELEDLALDVLPEADFSLQWFPGAAPPDVAGWR